MTGGASGLHWTWGLSPEQVAAGWLALTSFPLATGTTARALARALVPPRSARHAGARASGPRNPKAIVNTALPRLDHATTRTTTGDRPVTIPLQCAACGVRITAGYLCRADVDRGVGIFGELDGWAEELAATASGIRGQRAVDRRPTRVDPPGVVDEARLELARWLGEARDGWQGTASSDGCDDLAGSGAYFVGGWGRGPAFLAAMVGAEQRALGVLDPDEAVLREQRARQARHAAGARMAGGVGVPGARPNVGRLADALGRPA